MKTIKIATGTKRVDLSQEDFSAMARIRELLKEHRAILIDRLLADLTTYIQYQFNTRATHDQISRIKDRLSTLRFAEVSSFRFDSVINEILTNDMTHVKSEAFYFEINEIIGTEINPGQLELVK